MDIDAMAKGIFRKYIKPYRKLIYVPTNYLQYAARQCIDGSKKTVVFGYTKDVKRFMSCLPKYLVHTGGGHIRAEYTNPNDWVNLPGREFNNTELITKIASWEIDQLIIVSEDLRYLLQMHLIGEAVPYEFVDIYDIIKMEYGVIAINGIARNWIKNTIFVVKNRIKFLLYNYYKWKKQDWKINPIEYCDNYDAILVKKYHAQKATDSREKSFYLKEVIINYLMIHDYQNAFSYIDEFVEIFGTNNNSFLQLKEEYIELFLQMKEHLHNKQEKDIIIFWCDALPHEDWESWKFLSDLTKDSLVFQNAYTHIPYTHTTSQAMFTGIPYFEGKMYRTIETENMIEYGKTFAYLEREFYQIKEIGGNYTKRKYSRGDNYIIRSAYPPASIHLWETLDEILKEDRKKFVICHMDCELHNPYWNGESDRLRMDPGNFLADISDMEMQRKESAAYLEKQILFYTEFLGENTCKIFMSDHGIGGAAYSDRRLHAFCFVNDNGIVKGKYNKAFSYLKFKELIQYILYPTQSNFHNIFSDYVLIQNDHPYSEKYCTEIMKKLKNNEDVPKVKWMGFRGIIKDGYKFLYFPDGEEIWFDSAEREIDPKDLDHTLVKFMRENVGNEFPDINVEEHYVHTKSLYNALQIKL